MKTYKPFSVVVVPFPFVDGANKKRRPALVVSHEQFQKKNGHVTLLMITSAKHSEWYGDHEISDLQTTGLTASSIVRQKIFTLDMRLIEKQVGKLIRKDSQAVKQNMKLNLSIA